MKHTIKKLPKAQVEIEIELSAEELDKFLNQALEHMKSHVKVDGFRPGNVPKNIVEEKVGKDALLAEAADIAVNDSYTKVVKENNLEPIAHPEIQVIKLAKGNPFIFKITVSVLPEIKLADYKAVASKTKKQEVSIADEEIDQTLVYLQRSRAKFSQLDKPAEEKDFVEIEYESSEFGPLPSVPGEKKENPKAIKDEFILGEGGFIPGFEKNIVGMKTGETKEFSLVFPKDAKKKELAGRPWRASPLAGKEVKFKVKVMKVQKVELPEINNEFAKTLGEFENVEMLKRNVKEGMLLEKAGQEKERQRSEILEIVAEKSNLETPEVLINFEKERLFKSFQHKIEHDYKMQFGDYLKSINQDEKTLKDSFTKEAEKKVKNFLLIREIGRKENILVTDQEVKDEADNILKNYPAESAKKIDINELKEYAKGVIYNEKVLQKLETFIKI